MVRLEQAIADSEAKYLGRVSKETYDAMIYAQGRIAARVVPKTEE